MQTCSGKGIKMAFLDVQSSSTPQSLPLLLFSHREGGGRGAGDPGAPAVVPAPVSAPRPASSPARSESRSPPLTLISRHITCCSCESPGDVLLSGRGGGGGGGGGARTGGGEGEDRRPRPDFSRVTAVAIPGWMEVESPPHPPPQPQVCPTPSQGAPGHGRAGLPEGKGPGGRDWLRSQSSRCSRATLFGHRAPSPAAPRRGRLPAPGFPSLHSAVSLF
uniref:Putative uncharacterized protein FLJ45840 n=1 Tax=Homo sapiens TaxID=9606 RepID=YF009_HUMAN|nr:RecName: Full=Putative uncharacterized protein FLJ45840 [Homo sapiens]